MRTRRAHLHARTPADAGGTPDASATPMLEGLTHDEAARRLAEGGSNDVVGRLRHSLAAEVARRFANPLVAVLLVATVASAGLRDFSNAGIIVGIVVLSIVVELVQSRRADHAVLLLAAEVAPTATVLRDGSWQDIPRTQVVVGDLVRLSAGDVVPADGEILEATDLHCSEAALTGESLPVEKHVGDVALMGASVVSGSARARVTKIGAATTMGSIAHALATRAGPTDFDQGIAKFGGLIGKTVVFLVLFVVLVGAVVHREPLETLLFAVALAVGMTPQLLPMITTVTLARGAVRMARVRVVVKNLAAIQSFGSIDILCTDKTGTLTTGELTLERHVDPFGEPSERPLLLAYVSSYFESGIENPLDAAVLEKGNLAPRAHARRVDPLDSAVLRHDHPDIHGYRKRDEVPFDFERRRVSVVAERDGERLLVTKGAPEHVLAIAVAVEEAGGERCVPIDDAIRERCRRVHESLALSGYRVLAVASRTLSEPGPVDKGHEHDLVLAGFVAFVDPPRTDARDAVDDLHREGIRVKVVTGDSDIVARDVCERVGIATGRVLVGSDIDAMSDPALAHEAEEVDVFARVTPAQKNRIVRALRGRGHVVGFLGDGINDAPSLHVADVGISVSSATDVAREAASIILLAPGLRVLHDGVLEGRRAFGNVMKYLLMGTSSSFGNMLSMAVAALALPFLPMLPKQILFNSFLYDLAQLTIPYDAVDAGFMRKPRRWDLGLVRRFMTWIGPISSAWDLLTFFTLVHVFRATPATFQTGWFVESLATQTLVIFVIRTSKSPFRSRPSTALVASALLVAAVGIVTPFSPLAPLLGFVPLPVSYFAFLVPATVSYLVLVEIAKRRLLRSEA